MSSEKPLPTIGLDRVYFAQLLTDTETGATYATPIKLPGAVQLTDTPNSENAPFYADDRVYVQTSRTGAWVAAVTLAGLDAEIYATLMGAVYNAANGQVTEGQNDVPLEGALGYRAQLPNNKYEYVWFMAGIFSRSEKSYDTKAESISYQPKPLQFNARPIMLADGVEEVLRRSFSTDGDDAPVGLTDALAASDLTGWFSDPNYVPVAPGVPVADFAIVAGSGSGELDATWSAPNNATSQKIQVLDPVSGEYRDATLEAPLAAGDALATITGLTPTNSYTARLIVVSGAENGISNTDTASATA